MALTGGKYSGWGRLNRKRYRDDDDQPPDDWLCPPDYDSGNFRQAISRARPRRPARTGFNQRRGDQNFQINIGFGQWQKSVYVSPHDIADDLAQMLRDNRMEDKVVPMIAKRILAGNDWDFARRIFHIDEIEKRYRLLIDQFENPPRSNKEFLRRQFNRYVQILQDDPLLPVGLAPKAGYGREQALAALKKYASGPELNL